MTALLLVALTLLFWAGSPASLVAVLLADGFLLYRSYRGGQT